MVSQALGMLETAFAKCAEWTGQLLGAVGGSGIVLAAFSLVLVVSLLFMPLRGFAAVVSPDSIADFTVNKIHKHEKRMTERRRSTSYLTKNARRYK